MPFVGRDLKTMTFQRQGQMKELEQKSKNRIYFVKNKQHTKDTGSSLIAGRPQKSTLEQYLDKSKIDENIENFLVKELSANSGQAKIFIQGLDDTLKEYLLDRLPAFKRVFISNFTIPSVINLQSAFELFNREQLNKIKDIEIPSAKDLQDYLRTLSEQKLYDLGAQVYIITERKRRGTNPADAVRDFSDDFERSANRSIYVRDVCVNFIRTFDTEIDGYISLSKIGMDVGLKDFPKPNLKKKDTGIPTSKINIDIEGTLPGLSEEGQDLLTRARRRVRTLPPLEENESETTEEKEREVIDVESDILGMEDRDIESGDFTGDKVKGVQRYLELFNNNNKQQLINIFDNYRDFYNSKTEEERAFKMMEPPQKSEITRFSKKDLILLLIRLGYNPRSEDFDIGQDYQGLNIEDADPQIMFVDEIDKLDDYIIANYNTQSGRQTRPQLDLTEMEGFGYMSKANKPGLVKIYKLRK
jgi:hypothetical protein